MTDSEYTESLKLYEGRVFGFIFKQTRNRELTQEIVQEAYLKLWVNKVKVDMPKVKSWLFTTAYNHMINQLKRENRYVSSDDVSESTLTATIPDFNRTEIIQTELKKMTQQQRRLIVLRDVHGYSYGEIGERMNLTDAQVKSYLFRARKILKDKFKDLNRYGG